MRSLKKPHFYLRNYGLYIILLCLCLAGCSPFTRYPQPIHTNTIQLSTTQTIGQTFEAEFDGLNSVWIYLSPIMSGDGEIQLDILADIHSDSTLAHASLSLKNVTTPGVYRFHFPALITAARRDFYIKLSITGNSEAAVGIAPGDSYLDGALDLNGNPLDAQLSFFLSYSRRWSLVGLLGEALTGIYRLAVGIFLFIIPGWGLLSLSKYIRQSTVWIERLSLAVGISLAIYPVLFLWTNLVGFNLGIGYAWFPPITGLVLMIVSSVKWLNHKPIVYDQQNTAKANRWIVKFHFPSLHSLLLSLIIFFVVFTRLSSIRTLDVPLWGDSYQHSVITQLLVDHGGLFDSWAPYAELQTLTYHFGFHSQAAVYAWLTRLPTPQAVLWTGQIINILAVLAVSPLVLRLVRKQSAVIVAILLAGLLLPMPNFYVNWGRYTQLAGLAILPAVIWLAWKALDEEHQSPYLLVFAGITLSGLALTHYRAFIFVLLFFVAFVVVYWIGRLFYAIRKKPDFIAPARFRVLVLRMFWMGLCAGVLFTPWLINIFQGQIPTTVSNQLTTPFNQLSNFSLEYNAFGDIKFYLPVLFWFLLSLSLVWWVWKRNQAAILIAGWWCLILLAANPQSLWLPGAGILTNFAVMIACYIPTSILSGAAIYEWGAGVSLKLIKGITRIIQPGLVLGLILASLWGARQRLNDLNIPDFALVTRADLRAVKWIMSNTSSESRFLVNAVPAYGGSSVVGTDGGLWLPFLAQRQTTLPPLTYTAERGPRSDYRQYINELPIQLAQKSIDDPKIIEMLNERDINYIYIGQRQGSVNAVSPTLDPLKLQASPNYQVVYHQDRVWIFRRASAR